MGEQKYKGLPLVLLSRLGDHIRARESCKLPDVLKYISVLVLIIINTQKMCCSCINVKDHDEVILKTDRSEHNVYYFDFHGKVIEAKGWEYGIEKKIDSASVQIFNEFKELVGEHYSNKAGMFRVKLPLNRQFTIEVSKKGWVHKIIFVDTRINHPKKGYYYFPFDVYLFEDIPSVDVSVLNRPVARITFNDYLNRFYFNHKFTDHVNKTLKKLYSAYYRYRAKNDSLRNHQNENYYAATDNYKEKSQSADDQNNAGPGTRGSLKLSQEMNNRKENYDPEEDERNSKPEIVYKIQILSLEGRIPMCAKVFERCGRVSEYIYNNEYKYTIGEFKSLRDAMTELVELRKNGYKDAFPVAFINGRRITVTEAVKISGRNKIVIVIEVRKNNQTNKMAL